MVCSHSGRQPTDGPGGPPVDRAHSAWLLSPHTSTLLLLFPPRLLKDLCFSSFLHFTSKVIWLETDETLHPALISVRAWMFFFFFSVSKEMVRWKWSNCNGNRHQPLTDYKMVSKWDEDDRRKTKEGWNVNEKPTCIVIVPMHWPCRHVQVPRLKVFHHIVVGFWVIVVLMTISVHPPAFLSGWGATPD